MALNRKKEQTLLKIINSNAKTNLHPIFCLKKIYIDEKRPLNQIFTSEEIRANWLKISQINPAFFNSAHSPTFELRLLGKKIIIQSNGGYVINKKYREEFKNIDWVSQINKRKKQTPPLLNVYNTLKDDRSKSFNINLFKNNILVKDKNLSPSLLEIFAYSVIKTHLWIFGADQNIHRYTKTNANDGGVDIACGDMIYCVTTNLTLSKIMSDAKKQVKNRLTFITVKDNIRNKETKLKILNNISKEQNVEISILDLENIFNFALKFDAIQQKRLRVTLLNELQNELKNFLQTK
jgi:hypothetical protein